MRSLSGTAAGRALLSPSWQLVLRCAGVLLAVGLLTAVLVPVREQLGPVNVVLIFLLLVILIAAHWGWGPGLFASLAANLAYVFFFVPPLHTLTVQDPHNVLALLIFLGLAALTSWMLARAHAGEGAARRREQETAVLYDLSRLIIVTPEVERTLAAICERVRHVFGVESCLVLVGYEGKLTTAAGSGDAATRPGTAYERRAAGDAFSTCEMVALGTRGRLRPRIVGMADRPAPAVFVPLRVGGQTVGVLQVIGALRARISTEDELRLLEAFADVTALAVERGRLLGEAAGAHALKETDRLKSALLSAVSHDLRTPLASIKSAVSGLLDTNVTWDEATRRELLTAVDEETDRLTRFVANLRDLSRIEGGALRPDKDWYEVRELLETVTARLARVVTRHRIVLEVADDTGEAPADYVQIGQVVTNLVENAAKFAPEGTEIRVTARRLLHAVEVAVNDQGPGIPPEERALAFEKCYRGRREGRRVSGAGLRLAICKGLVEAHGGEIRVEAAPGGGARFVFTLPVSSPVRAQRPAERADGVTAR